MFQRWKVYEGFQNEPSPAGEPSPADSVGTAGGPTSSTGMSESFLIQLMQRIDTELLALEGLEDSTTNANLLAKKNQLSSMRYAIDDLVRQLSANLIALRDIPFSVEEANAFLSTFGNPTNSSTLYPDLFTTAGGPSTASSAVSGTETSSGFDWSSFLSSMGSSEESQDLFKSIQDVKWKFELSYDPALSQKTNFLDRLESLEKRIMTYAQSGQPMPDDVKKVLTQELLLLTDAIQAKFTTAAPPPYQPRMTTQSSRTQETWFQDGSAHTTGRTAAGAYAGAGYAGVNANDVSVRPGFILTDDQIRHRASTAAFNPQVVGGADYKQRAHDLCRQIRNAGIGSPAEFGCIENPAEVSANYSWRGNYAMVCNRIGDTWGSWYPEMFGCPKYNPDDSYNGNLL